MTEHTTTEGLTEAERDSEEDRGRIWQSLRDRCAHAESEWADANERAGRYATEANHWESKALATEAERDAARAEVEALRERVGALADEYAVAAEAHKAALGSMGEVQLCTGVVADLRAALDADR